MSSCCAQHHVLSSAPAFLLESWSTSPYLTTIILGPPLLLLLLFYPALLYLSPKETKLGSEAFFYSTATADSKARLPLPHLIEENDGEDARIQLSVVVPAYNEQSRLQKMLTETVDYLEGLKSEGKNIASLLPNNQNGHSTVRHPSKTALEESLLLYEILIIDDGSRDDTVAQAMTFAKKNKSVDSRIVKMGRNCGKGAAVRHGVLHSRGQVILFCDADGATRFSDISVLAKELSRIMTPAGHGIVCGSRAHLVGSEAVVKRSFVRNLLMHSFHLVLSLLMRPPNPFAYLPSFTSNSLGSRQTLPSQPPIRDTQCGFKLFSRPSAQVIFPLSHIDRWIFDVELLLLAELASSRTLTNKGASMEWSTKASDKKEDTLRYLPLPISEVAVDWREVEGSKIDLLRDSIGMALDLVVIRLNYALGRWKSPPVVATGEAKCAMKK